MQLDMTLKYSPSWLNTYVFYLPRPVKALGSQSRETRCFGVARTPEFMAPRPVIKNITTFDRNPIGSFASGRKGHSR